MNFNELHASIPAALGKPLYAYRMTPYPNITIAAPGKHQEDTDPPGMDFVVMVTDRNKNWTNHKFTHDDLFRDLAEKTTPTTYHRLVQKDPKQITQQLMASYLSVVRGAAPSSVLNTEFDYLTGLRASTLLQAVQCLAVAEHRRFARFEKQWGGRFLPLRFSCGIVEGLWTAEQATAVQKYGRPAVERLEKENGIPTLTKELFNT